MVAAAHGGHVLSHAELLAQIGRPPHTNGEHPAPTIDGGKTPWLIPDDVAYSIFLTSLRPRGDAKLDAHRLTLTKHIFMPKCDVLGFGCPQDAGADAIAEGKAKALLAVATQYSAAYHALSVQVRSERSANAAAADAHYRDARLRLLDNARAEIRTQLDADSFALIDTHIANVVKASITYYDGR
jgi:hypothetical protein